MRVLGISAGAGVMLWPFRKYLVANIEPRGDYRTPGNIQWELNFAGIPLLQQYDLPDFQDIDLIISHPTCGHSSSLAYSRGKKLGDAKKDATLALFLDSLDKYKPKAFLFENLPNLYKSFPDFESHLSDYKIHRMEASMAHFGNSQISRVRLVIIGVRKDIKLDVSSVFKLPKLKTHKLKRVFELEKGLELPDADLCNIREDENTIVCMEKDFRKLSLKEIKDEWNSKKYKNRKKWDATTTGKGNMRNLPGVYRNLPNSYPLTARKQNRQFNSRGEIMSPRELARIQGLDSKFKIWYDPKSSKYCLNKGRVSVTKCPPVDLTKWFKRKLKKSELWQKLNAKKP